MDAATGAVLYRQSLSSDATGSATAWEFYPSDLVPAGANTANPVTFPVDDGTRLFGPNAHVWSDVKDNNKPDAGEETSAVSGTNWSMPAILNDVGSLAGLQHGASVHVGQGRAVQLASEPGAERGAGHVLPEPVPRPLGVIAVRLHVRGGQLRERGPRCWDRRDDGANSKNGLPDQNHFNNANMGTPPDGHSPTMQMYLFHADQGLPLSSVNGGDDAEVVYHEYTHGLSNRLVLYPDGTSGLSNQQGNSMGEGWSDWYAEDFLNNLGFKPDTAHRR